MNLWDKYTFAYLCNDSARDSTTMLRKESTVPLCGIIININKNSRKYHYIFWTYHLYSISEAKLYLLFIKNTMQFTPTHRCLWGAYGLFWMCVYAFRWEILRISFRLQNRFDGITITNLDWYNIYFWLLNFLSNFSYFSIHPTGIENKWSHFMHY